MTESGVDDPEWPELLTAHVGKYYAKVRKKPVFGNRGKGFRGSTTVQQYNMCQGAEYICIMIHELAANTQYGNLSWAGGTWLIQGFYMFMKYGVSWDREENHEMA